MAAEGGAAASYAVPRYRAAEGAAFFHVLHGHVPGHQIDFMYAPEVPQGDLTTTHFSHLARLMKYMEPQPGARHAFAIANLSRDDTQFEPGHGCLGLMLGLRIEGVVDHTGRKDPPFAHAIAGVNRAYSSDALSEAAGTMVRHILGEGEAEKVTTDFYRRYVACAADAPERMPDVLASYVGGFADLPDVPRSRLAWAWKAREGAETPRVVIAYDDEPFELIADVAARIAAVLYCSNIRWTQVSTGGERDLPGGVTVRLVMRKNLSAHLRDCLLLDLGDVPDDDEGIASVLFGAGPAAEVKAQPVGWRERYAYQQPGDRDGAAGGVGEASRPPYASGGDTGERVTWMPVAEAITRVAPLQATEGVGVEKSGMAGGAAGGGAAGGGAGGGLPLREGLASERPGETPAARASGAGFAIPWQPVVADMPEGRASAPSWPGMHAERTSAPVIDLVHKKTPLPVTPRTAERERSSESVNPYERRRSRGPLWAGLALLCVIGVAVIVWQQEGESAGAGGRVEGADAGVLATRTPTVQDSTAAAPGDQGATGAPSASAGDAGAPGVASAIPKAADSSDAGSTTGGVATTKSGRTRPSVFKARDAAF